jgi:hypothetical protein
LHENSVAMIATLFLLALSISVCWARRADAADQQPLGLPVIEPLMPPCVPVELFGELGEIPLLGVCEPGALFCAVELPMLAVLPAPAVPQRELLS